MRSSIGVGAEDDFYSSAGNHPDIPEEYKAKNSDFESVEELRLVRWIDESVLYGNDRNHNGVLDEAPTDLAAGLQQAANDGRGIYPFVTAWGVKATANVQTASAQGATAALADVNSTSTTRLRTLLETNVPAKADDILTLTRRLRPFTNVFDWYFKVGLTQEEFSKIFVQLAANPPVSGGGGGTTQPAISIAPRLAKVNVYTASREVLYCLPGLDQGDADAILGQRNTRSTTTPSDLSWLVSVLDPEKLSQMGGYVTGTSKVYSADIVAVASDGKAFKRVKIVIDARTSPSKIIYRRDMTSAGWPLDVSVLETLKEGRGLGNLTPLTQSNWMTQN
jgi:DNA uptake protein ComE-like DNA-binding protein